MDMDLILSEGDAVLENDEPQFFSGKQVIEQSLRNRIYEKSLLQRLIGERGLVGRKVIYQEIVQEIELDERVEPGSCKAKESDAGLLLIGAKSVSGDDLDLLYNFVAG